MQSNRLFMPSLLLAFVLSCLSLKSNGQVFQQIGDSFSTYLKSTLQEKVFVHTDKSVYLAGEIIWFKVYCVDGDDHRPIGLSKVVYIDLLDRKNNAVSQAKISLENGIGDGSIYIPMIINDGVYVFRAYTSWMKNFKPDFYFKKNITLINALKSVDTTKKEAAVANDIRFFPEGGSLLAGIENKVAFKAVGQDGKGLDLTGFIVNQRNDTVVKFSSLKFGMGSFLFTPNATSKYRAFVKIGMNNPIEKELPIINKQGYMMSLRDNGSQQLNVTLRTTQNDPVLYLFVHTRQQIKAAESVVITDGVAHFTLDKNRLGEGISHLSIFNSRKQPVCERLYFKRPAQHLLLKANADQPDYGLRKEVKINVSAQNFSGKIPNANLSVSVYRVDSLQALDRSDIFSYLWLSSDLKGTIESPDYYFDDKDKLADQALDNLMLTQGWSRFQWSEVLEKKAPVFKFSPEFTGHLIAGRVINTRNAEPQKNILCYLAIPGKRIQVYTSKSDSSGNLLFNTKDFYGPGELVVQTNQLTDSLSRIDILSPFSEQYSNGSLPPFEFDKNMQNTLQEHSLGTQILNLYSGNDLERFHKPLVDSLAFFGKPYKTYKLDDFTRFTTLEEDLREYVSEDNIVKSNGSFHIKVLDENIFLDGDPLVLVDGVPFFNLNKVMSIDPLKLNKLDVVRSRHYYGPSEEEGVFSFTTYKADLEGIDLDPRAVVLDYEGMQLRREFYSPVYDTEVNKTSRLPDFRNLLYWNPSVNLNDNNNVLSFYTSELKGKFIGLIQGITKEGEAGSCYFSFGVN